MRTVWKTWNWRDDPAAPRQWGKPGEVVVIADGFLEEPATTQDPQRMAANDTLVADLRHAVVVFVESLGTFVRPMAPFGPRRIPALRVEHRQDLDEGLRALCSVQAKHRALVVTPREPLPLGLIGTLPAAWGPGYHLMRDFVDLVVVRGPTGETKCLSPAWVRQIRDECAEAEVAFAFTGWGRWAPHDHLDSLARRMGPFGRVESAPTFVPRDLGELFYDAGEEFSGRLLDKREHLALPDGL